jgi:hypothetical protein
MSPRNEELVDLKAEGMIVYSMGEYKELGNLPFRILKKLPERSRPKMFAIQKSKRSNNYGPTKLYRRFPESAIPVY